MLLAFGAAVRCVKIPAPGHHQLLLAGRMPIRAIGDFAAHCTYIATCAAVLKHRPCYAVLTDRPTDFGQDFLRCFKPRGALRGVSMAAGLARPCGCRAGLLVGGRNWEKRGAGRACVDPCSAARAERCLAATGAVSVALGTVALDVSLGAVPCVVALVFHIRPKAVGAVPGAVKVVVVPTMQTRAVLPWRGAITTATVLAARCRVPLVICIVIVIAGPVLRWSRAWSRLGSARRRSLCWCGCRGAVHVVEI